MPTEADGPTHRYYVDEAGDLTLFDRRGRILVGQEGVSRCFIVGAALVHDAASLTAKLSELREELLADPYFAGVPSLRKTARAFHAKDDLAEVRREVFRLLRDADVEVYVGFRRKQVLAEDFRAHFERTGRKLNSEAVYESLVTEVFRNRLHLGSGSHIVFARRGKSDRNVALQEAIRHAKRLFELRWQKGIDRPVSVASSTPSETPELQVVDYYLWALQRLLERGEDRFFNALRPAYKLIVDRDDQRYSGAGAYYTTRNPLSLEQLMPVV